MRVPNPLPPELQANLRRYPRTLVEAFPNSVETAQWRSSYRKPSRAVAFAKRMAKNLGWAFCGWFALNWILLPPV